jgi:hypothetical protein
MIENQHTTKCWAWLSTNCCTPFWWSSLRMCISTKSFIRLGSYPKAVVSKIKILSVKYIYKKQLIKKMDVIKKNLIIGFACETNETEWPMWVVTEPWIYRLRFLVPDYDYHVKRSDVTCWIYSTHIVSEMYGGLKSFQTAMSFQPGRSLSFVYFLGFLCVSY